MCAMEAKAMCLSYAHVSIAAQSVFICWGVVPVLLESVCCLGLGGGRETWIEGWREEGGVK